MANAKPEMTHRRREELSPLRGVSRDCSAEVVTLGRFLCTQNKKSQFSVIQRFNRRTASQITVHAQCTVSPCSPTSCRAGSKKFHFTKVFTLSRNVLKHWFYLWLYESASKAVLFILFLWSLLTQAWCGSARKTSGLLKMRILWHVTHEINHFAMFVCQTQVCIISVLVPCPAQGAAQKGWHMACQCRWLLNAFALLTAA